MFVVGECSAGLRVLDKGLLEGVVAFGLAAEINGTHAQNGVGMLLDCAGYVVRVPHLVPFKVVSAIVHVRLLYGWLLKPP